MKKTKKILALLLALLLLFSLLPAAAFAELTEGELAQLTEEELAELARLKREKEEAEAAEAAAAAAAAAALAETEASLGDVETAVKTAEQAITGGGTAVSAQAAVAVADTLINDDGNTQTTSALDAVDAAITATEEAEAKAAYYPEEINMRDFEAAIGNSTSGLTGAKTDLQTADDALDAAGAKLTEADGKLGSVQTKLNAVQSDQTTAAAAAKQAAEDATAAIQTQTGLANTAATAAGTAAQKAGTEAQKAADTEDRASAWVAAYAADAQRDAAAAKAKDAAAADTAAQAALKTAEQKYAEQLKNIAAVKAALKGSGTEDETAALLDEALTALITGEGNASAKVAAAQAALKAASDKIDAAQAALDTAEGKLFHDVEVGPYVDAAQAAVLLADEKTEAAATAADTAGDRVAEAADRVIAAKALYKVLSQFDETVFTDAQTALATAKAEAAKTSAARADANAKAKEAAEAAAYAHACVQWFYEQAEEDARAAVWTDPPSLAELLVGDGYALAVGRSAEKLTAKEFILYLFRQAGKTLKLDGKTLKELVEDNKGTLLEKAERGALLVLFDRDEKIDGFGIATSRGTYIFFNEETGKVEKLPLKDVDFSAIRVM